MIKLKYILLSALSILVLSCKNQHLVARPYQVDSAKAVVNFQQKKVYKFNNEQILFSNNFAAARANLITQQNDSTFNIIIKPENEPVNPSPWFAFKVWSAKDKKIYIKLNYEGSSHRYNPKIQHQNKIWEDVANVKISNSKKEAFFSIKVSADTTLVAAQELISVADNYQWEDSLTMLPFVKKQKIGQSILGKVINALSIGNNEKRLIVVLSRQHPPEVTGYMAMQEFIRSVTSNTELAKNFRKKYQLLLIPLINPDGVDEGNWRHSAAGVDLNRDWEHFLQPETRSVRDYLLKKIEHQNVKIYFGIDFHSTYYDVFYTNEDQPANTTNIPGFTMKWLNAFSERIPDFKPNIKPSPNGGNVSKSWMGRVLHAEALTYEVGDDTPRPLLKLKGRIAAEKMMELLLATPNNN